MSFRLWTSPVTKSQFASPRSTASCFAATSTPGTNSSPVTWPSGTRAAKSTVIVPGPQPTSRTLSPGLRWGRRYAAELAAVRHEWERRTDAWWPCVYLADSPGVWRGVGRQWGRRAGMRTVLAVIGAEELSRKWIERLSATWVEERNSQQLPRAAYFRPARRASAGRSSGERAMLFRPLQDLLAHTISSLNTSPMKMFYTQLEWLRESWTSKPERAWP